MILKTNTSFSWHHCDGCEHDGHGVCLGDGQTEAYLKNTGMIGLASAWAMARRRTKEYRHRWTRRRAAPAYAPIPDILLPCVSSTHSQAYCPILHFRSAWLTVCCYFQMTGEISHPGLASDTKFLNYFQRSYIRSFRSDRITSRKDYICEICGKRAINKSNLDAHRNVHLGVRPYQCSVCGLAATQKNNVVCHLIAKHSMDIVTAKSSVIKKKNGGAASQDNVH